MIKAYPENSKTEYYLRLEQDENEPDIVNVVITDKDGERIDGGFLLSISENGVEFFESVNVKAARKLGLPLTVRRAVCDAEHLERALPYGELLKQEAQTSENYGSDEEEAW